MIVSRSDLKLEPPFTDKFHTGHLLVKEDGSRIVLLHGPLFYPDGLRIPELRYRWSVDAGRILSQAEFDQKWLTEKGPA